MVWQGTVKLHATSCRVVTPSLRRGRVRQIAKQLGLREFPGSNAQQQQRHYAVARPDGAIIDRELHDEAKTSYVSYAMSVIVGRALPDVRDGLKPVHRRILYAMRELGLDANKPFRKSARVVGEVLGRYHPHGDTAVYAALVRMAQPFLLRACLVNGHGNFGSIDKDPAAAMRYTECRLQRLTADMLLADLSPAVVDFQPNFDDSCEEPSVLPAKVPQLLLNGTHGIAVGIATRIPPHNLREVVAAMSVLVKDPHASDEELLQHVQGPDFPTGGQIIRSPGLRSMYTEGKGSLVVRGSVHIEMGKSGRSTIVVTELPYQVYKAQLIQAVAAAVESGALVGISDIQDESDRRGMRIAIEVKRGSDAQVVLNGLLKHSSLQTRIAASMVALVDNLPQSLTLRGMLQAFIDFRFQVILRRSMHSLAQKEARLHIVEGFRIAVGDVEAVVAAIRAARDGQEAREALQGRWAMSTKQADAVLGMSLRRLTGLAVDELTREHATLSSDIQALNDLIADRAKVNRMMIAEAQQIADAYGEDRRTVIADASVEETPAPEALIANEPSVLVMSANGHIKRMSAATFQPQRRGGIGKTGGRLREDDVVHSVIPVMSHDHLLAFASSGAIYRLRAFDVPERSRTAAGSAVAELLPKLKAGVSIAAVVPVAPRGTRSQHLLLLTRQGKIKRIRCQDLERARQGSAAIKLREGDSVCFAAPCDDDDAVMTACSQGKVATFAVADIRPSGRAAMGVNAKRINQGHHIVGASVLRRASLKQASRQQGPWACFATSSGACKRVSLSEFALRGRPVLGVVGTPLDEGSDLVTLEVVDAAVDKVSDFLAATRGGKMARIPLDEIPVYGRMAKGVRTMALQDGDALRALIPCKFSQPSANSAPRARPENGAVVADEALDQP